MRCETFLEQYDRLDNRRALAPLLRLHLASCSSCRSKVLRTGAALDAYRRVEPSRSDLLEERIMSAVRLLPHPRRVVSVRDWVVTGGLIALSMALIPLGDQFDSIKAFFGSSYALPLALVLGFILTAYGALFIGSHMSELGPLVKERYGRHS